MEFTDRDLTDTYPDARSNASTGPARHPRGNSPINPATQPESPASASSFRSARGDARETPSLDRLLAFLDEGSDDDGARVSTAALTRAMDANLSQAVASPQTRLPVPSTSTPPPSPPRAARPQSSPRTRQAPPSQDSDLSRSTSVHPASAARLFEAQGARWSTQNETFGDGIGDSTPLKGDGSRRTQNVEREAWNGEETTAGKMGTRRSVVEDDVLREFESIVSIGSPTNDLTSTSRPRSRLRNIYTPPLSPITNGRGPAHLAPSKGVEVKLADELRAARAQVAHLQAEMREINALMHRLQDSEPTRSHRHRRRRVPLDEDDAYSGGDESIVTKSEGRRRPDPEAGQDAWNIARHILALLPTPTSPTSLHSLSLSLEFTRAVDALVHHDADGRADDVVFTRINLERLMGRLAGWERVVRE